MQGLELLAMAGAVLLVLLFIMLIVDTKISSISSIEYKRMLVKNRLKARQKNKENIK